ncbi:MAG: RluA family pseudouridine synthase [Bacteroidaceae bacterium]|nr:RluA family pseudouridine synthase [Bacteroidaceae bacterium]
MSQSQITLENLLHSFPPETKSIPSPAQFTYPFCYHPHPLCSLAAKEVIEYCYRTPEMYPHEGKMFGVLVVAHKGERYYLRAFSGIYNGSYHHKGFVPPVYDLQAPDGYFCEEEQRIVELTRQVNEATSETEKIQLKALRKEASQALQTWTFRQFRLLNANKQVADLLDIFKDYKTPFSEEEYINYKEGRTPIKPKPKVGIPPGGSGECCAPKLLQFAYQHDLSPLCMEEFWVGPSEGSQMRIEGHFYPSCQHKCVPILTYMMQGLDVEENPLFRRGKELLKQVRILHEDDDLMIAYKPSGLLSVPSRNHGEVSLQAHLETINSEYRLVHRLDQDTSGLMLVAKNLEACRHLQEQFVQHDIKKKYIAILSSPPMEGMAKEGIITLPLSRNPFDSPRQTVNHRIGKQSITRYRLVGDTRVELFPETGRTHQLRIHCAHPEGLGRPIKGDILYGTAADRLYLHAESITFRHPTTGEWMTFTEKAF